MISPDLPASFFFAPTGSFRRVLATRSMRDGESLNNFCLKALKRTFFEFEAEIHFTNSIGTDNSYVLHI